MKTTQKLTEKMNVALDKINLQGKDIVTYLVSPKNDIKVHLVDMFLKVYSKEEYYKLTICTSEPKEVYTMEDLEFWVASPSGSGKFSRAEMLDLFEHVKKKSIQKEQKL